MPASDLNVVLVSGTVASEVERTETRNGDMLRFRLRSVRRWESHGEQKEAPNFFTVVVFGDLADAFGGRIRGKAHLVVHGRLEVRSFMGEGGTRKYETRVVASAIDVGGEQPSHPAKNEPNDRPEMEDDDWEGV